MTKNAAAAPSHWADDLGRRGIYKVLSPRNGKMLYSWQ
jgi:hypothetical protein